jgi:hypothetical protein
MSEPLSFVRKFTWFYAVNFLIIVAISHWPGLTDSSGKLLGLFMIDPVDDIFHLLSGLAAAAAAWASHDWSLRYLKYAGIPYAIDALTGIFFNTQFLNGDAFTQGLGQGTFTLNSFLNNGPHVIIPVLGWVVAFWPAKKA